MRSWTYAILKAVIFYSMLLILCLFISDNILCATVTACVYAFTLYADKRLPYFTLIGGAILLDILRYSPIYITSTYVIFMHIVAYWNQRALLTRGFIFNFRYTSLAMIFLYTSHFFIGRFYGYDISTVVFIKHYIVFITIIAMFYFFNSKTHLSVRIRNG